MVSHLFFHKIRHIGKDLGLDENSKHEGKYSMYNQR
jgi:hypothetical protein